MPLEIAGSSIRASFDADFDAADKKALRKWWHQILREHSSYSCFAILLILPADKEAIRYLSNFGRDLHLISGDNCLVISLAETTQTKVKDNHALDQQQALKKAKRSLAILEKQVAGYTSLSVPPHLIIELEDKRQEIAKLESELAIQSSDHVKPEQLGLANREIRMLGFDDHLWKTAVKEQVSEGHSIKVAQLFDIPLSEFPSVVLFRDIRSPEHLTISLKNLTAEEIAEQMRGLFTIINKAAKDKEDPLTTVEHHRNNEQFRKTGGLIISKLNVVAGRTFETAMEAVIKTIIK